MQIQPEAVPVTEASANLDKSDATAWLYRAAILLFVMFAGMFLSQPWPSYRLLSIVADDAFYYLGVARHIATSGISTFDGVNVTNGYHPGWLAILAVCALVVSDRVVLLKLALGLCLVFHFAGSVVLVDVVRRLGAPRLAWTAGALWLINPALLLIAMHGVEAPLVLFAMAICVRLFLIRIVGRIRPDEPYTPATADLAWFGASLAFVFWARTDGIILAAIGVAITAFLAARHGGTWQGARAALWVGGVFALCIAPWLLYSYAIVGTVRQDSGAVKMAWAHFYFGGPGLHWIRLCYEYGRQYWIAGPISLMLGAPMSLWAACAAVGAVLFCLLFGASRARGETPAPLRWATWWLLSYTVVSSAFCAVALADPQRWYYAEPLFVFMLLGAAWLPRATESYAWIPKLRRGFAVHAALFAVGTALLIKCTFWTPVLYPWQWDVYLSQPYFATLVPIDERIGCFNAGIPGYFSDDVIDLDGLVNHSVVPYWKAHRFSQYLEDAHVHYLADEVDAINRGEAFSAIPYKLMPMKSVALHFWKHPTRTLCQVGPLGSAGDGPVNPRSGRRAALAALRRSGPRRD